MTRTAPGMYEPGGLFGQVAESERRRRRRPNDPDYDERCNHHGPGEHCGEYLLHTSCPHTRGEGS